MGSIPAELSGTQNDRVSVRVPKKLATWYKAEALARSEPDDRVTAADLYREALAEFANKHSDQEDE